MSDFERAELLGRAREAARHWALGRMGRPVGTGAGDMAGAAAGSGVEFHDFRAYQPGDDPRHIDWGAYARSDTLVVRRHRLETSPWLEVALDTYAGMGFHPGKADHALFATAVLLELARKSGMRTALHLRGRRHTGEAVVTALSGFVPHGPGEGPPPLQAAGITQSIRVVVSDFLAPLDAAEYLATLARGAGAVGLVVVLAEEERHPRLSGAWRLVDAGNPARHRDLRVDAGARKRYEARLAAHLESLRASAIRTGAAFSRVDVPGRADGLDGLERRTIQALLAAGMVEGM